MNIENLDRDKIPYTTAILDKDGNVVSTESHNMENFVLPEWETKQFARWILDACQKFYADPKNVERFNKWKAEREK